MTIGVLLLALACLIALAHNGTDAIVYVGRGWKVCVQAYRSLDFGLALALRFGDLDFAAAYGVGAHVTLGPYAFTLWLRRNVARRSWWRR